MGLHPLSAQLTFGQTSPVGHLKFSLDNLDLEVSVFLIELTYKKSLSEVDHFVNEHSEYLDRNYKSGSIVFSGRKNPRDGGLILTTFKTLEEVNEMVQQDPFHREQIANYRIIEFLPSKFDPRFKCFLD